MAKTSTYENPGEMYFRWYCEELVTEGYLESFDREPETIIVVPDQKHKRVKRYKEKNNIDEFFTFLPAATYTYDFRLIWTEKALNIFTEVYSKDVAFQYGVPFFVSHYVMIDGVKKMASYVDVKPPSAVAKFGGGKLSTFYTFPFVQKFLFATRGLYINKIIPANSGKHSVTSCLFAQTFIPNRFRYTDSGQQQRNLRIKKTPLVSFVKQRKEIIEELDRIEEKKRQKSAQQSLL